MMLDHQQQQNGGIKATTEQAHLLAHHRSVDSQHLQHRPSERDSLHGGGSGLGPAVDLLHPHRKVGAWGLALLTFFNVSGGPWGSEPIVSSAGPLPGFICLLGMALFWGLPISLVTSEMSSALPNNGGYVLWVDTAFGGFWGFQESFWSWGSCVVDNALYPVLAYETFIAMYQGDVANPMDSDALEAANSWWFAYISKLILTFVFSLPVLIGKTEWVTKGMGVMVVLLFVPFAVMLPYMVLTRPMHWGQLLVSKPNLLTNPTVDWVGLLHVTFWNFNGFDCASTCAGEVRDPGRSYPKGLLSALVVIVLMTGVPLTVAVAANTPEWDKWDVGWWSAIANQNAGVGFAWSVVFSSLVGTFGMHAAVMWEDAWQLCGMAEQGLAPRWLAGRNEKLGTPQNATIMSMLVVMALIMFDFRSMVIVDNFFSVASGLLEIAAFAHLKRTRPDLSRPFSIPGVSGDVSLLLFLVMPVSLGSFVLITSFNDGWVSVLTLVPFLIVGLLLPSAFKSHAAKHHVLVPDHLSQLQRKSTRGLSFSKSEDALLVASPAPNSMTTASVGGVYGALHLNSQLPRGMNREPSRDSLYASVPVGREDSFPNASQAGGEDADNNEADGHIFVDDSVQFGSIFTDPKLFRQEDDEFLSAVGRTDLDFQHLIDDDDEEEQLGMIQEEEITPRRRTLNGRSGSSSAAATSARRTGGPASAARRFQDQEDEEFFGTDEERSYDEASLD